jgi:methylated-DNA-[protein]-cysteine S-methyltransferase
MKVVFSVRASASGVTAVNLVGRRRGAGRAEAASAGRWRRAAESEIGRYLSGRLRSFSVPCDLSELAGFTRAVLRITARIPYGQVRSYRWIAERLGRPKASRAVGNALARNPVPIIIPCHRVTRSDGALGGYALGLGWKIRLLKLERNSVAR